MEQVAADLIMIGGMTPVRRPWRGGSGAYRMRARPIG
jgi:hypothetical protein